jgi:hypothetical protein
MQLVTVYLEEQHTTLDLDLYLVFFFVSRNMSIQYGLHIKDQFFFPYGKTVIIGFTLSIIPLGKWFFNVTFAMFSGLKLSYICS